MLDNSLCCINFKSNWDFPIRSQIKMHLCLWFIWSISKTSHILRIRINIFLFLQLWDIRGGYCLQTFTGHESDINSIVVSQTCLDNQLMELTLNILVFPQWLRICHRKWRCHMPNVWHPVWSGAGRVQPRQHYLWHHERGIQQVRSSSPGRLRRFQLQCLGLASRRTSR